MKLLVKVGGTLLDAPAQRAAVAAELASVSASNGHTVVVHGGGKQMTRFLAERGIESRFINGLRVTTSETLDAVLKVFAGSVNQELVASLVAHGALAVGLTGMDSLLAEAEPLNAELGFVGRVVRSDAGLLNLLTAHGYLPVVACVAGNRAGEFYNVNADGMAVACAVSFKAERLFFLTDVAGVRGATGDILRSLSVAECGQLIQDQVATGGMQAKLEAAISAVEQGVEAVVIAPGSLPRVVTRLLAGEEIGTVVHS